MATVKIKVRQSGVQGKAGTILYQISHRHLTRQISTDIRIEPNCWDSKLQRIIHSNAESYSIQEKIEGGAAVLSFIIKKFESRGMTFTADDIVTQFHSQYAKSTIQTFMKDQIDYMIRCNRIGTARNYERTMRSFSRFTGGDIPVAAISEKLIDNYNAYLLQRGIVRNSVSFYMRVLRAVYNKAVRQHLAEQTNPFQNVYTGIDKTRKRAVDEKLIAELFRLDLDGYQLELARDIFIFSFCTRGMAFVDIAYLKKTNIQNGMIHYTRHKTGQLLSVRIEPGIQDIIRRYENRTKATPYVFPIIQSTEAAEAYNQYRKGINTYNRQLRKLSKLLSLDGCLSSYTARHSWATAAHKHNVPMSIISAGLGHTSEKTTQIYLAALGNNEIDIVNKGIISGLYK